MRGREPGINNLKIAYNRVFGYYIEVTNSRLSLVPEDYSRRQTLAGGERFISPELKEYEEQILTAAEKITGLEASLFEEVRKKAAAEARRVKGHGVCGRGDRCFLLNGRDRFAIRLLPPGVHLPSSFRT